MRCLAVLGRLQGPEQLICGIRVKKATSCSFLHRSSNLRQGWFLFLFEFPFSQSACIAIWIITCCILWQCMLCHAPLKTTPGHRMSMMLLKVINRQIRRTVVPSSGLRWPIVRFVTAHHLLRHIYVSVMQCALIATRLIRTCSSPFSRTSGI